VAGTKRTITVYGQEITVTESPTSRRSEHPGEYELEDGFAHQSTSAEQRPLKDRDFYAWLRDQTASLRSEQFGLLDCKGIAEELEAMGASERRELKSRLIVLVAHLLKWRYAGEQRLLHGWGKTIREQRRQLSDIIADSPSLKDQPELLLPAIYDDARKDALDDTGLDIFPDVCPWDIAQILSPDFWPNS
jgi:Domain of unknown function DUF29